MKVHPVTTETIKIKPAVDPANPRYYLDKVEMHKALKQYKDACAEAEQLNKEMPQIPNYIGECFLGIAKGYAMKYNFRSYSFVNDMVGDAVMTCIKYVRSYDPDRRNDSGTATSPLAYFTQCCHYAFLGRIAQEAKQAKLKRAMILSANFDTFSLNGDDDAADFHLHLTEFSTSLGSDDDILAERKREKKVQQPKPGPLDSFLE
jgi:hypothetical protein